MKKAGRLAAGRAGRQQKPLGVRRVLEGVAIRENRPGGIEIGERVPIPDYLVPPDASVEMEAKKAAGYFTPGPVPDAEELKKAKGRALGS